MKCTKAHLGTASVVALVALRICVGWHFYKEGLNHYADAKWSSEGFLKQAKGPLAGWYQKSLPDFHGWSRLLLVSEAAPPHAEGKDQDAKNGEPAAKPWDKWLVQVDRDWLVLEKKTADHYGFSGEQSEAARKLHDTYRTKMEEALAAYEDDIHAYQHESVRLGKLESVPGANDIPNLKTRIAAKEKDLTGEQGLSIDNKPAAWLEDAKTVEVLFVKNLQNLADAKQQDKGPPPAEVSSLQKQDKFVTYSLLAIGACLIVGFLTPLASAGGIAFLLSIVATQPFWLADASPTFNQYVEIFALLFLAVSGAGRYGGLDFFLSRRCWKCCSKKDDSQ